MGELQVLFLASEELYIENGTGHKIDYDLMIERPQRLLKIPHCPSFPIVHNRPRFVHVP